MIVCLCRRVSESDIHEAAGQGCGSFAELQQRLGVGTGCGACVDCACATFDDAAVLNGPPAGNPQIEQAVIWAR